MEQFTTKMHLREGTYALGLHKGSPVVLKEVNDSEDFERERAILSILNAARVPHVIQMVRCRCVVSISSMRLLLPVERF